MGLKLQILNTANILIDLLELCDDGNFVDSVIGAIYYNDKEPLWTLEDELREEDEEEY